MVIGVSSKGKQARSWLEEAEGRSGRKKKMENEKVALGGRGKTAHAGEVTS